MIKVLKRGTNINLLDTKINAIITAICIRDNNISYEVSYFNNGVNVNVWLTDIEFTVIDKGIKMSIGFT